MLSNVTQNIISCRLTILVKRKESGVSVRNQVLLPQIYQYCDLPKKIDNMLNLFDIRFTLQMAILKLKNTLQTWEDCWFIGVNYQGVYL